jgi:transposase
MKAYSLDLRERVAAACQQPGRTLGAVAAQFSVSVSFVEKLLQRQRTSGSLAPLPLRGGPAQCLDASSRADVVACLRQQPDATLDELRVWMAALGGPAVSVATMGRAVQAVGWRRKKRASTPPSATPSG